MKAACSNCGAQHSLPDAQLVGRPRVQFCCAKCGTATVIDTSAGPDISARPDATQVLSPLPQFARSAGAPRLSRAGADLDTTLRLPEGKAIALSIIAGPARGLVFPVQKPRLVVGRSGADVDINDAEISRWHCAIEIKDDVVRIRDLESTNGTFFGDERVRVAELKHLSEFRIGVSVILLTITPRLATRTEPRAISRHFVLPYRFGFSMPALTAILIAYNEELDLPRALGSLEGVADEIVLVDSGSTDRTCELARQLGARVYFRKLDSLAEQKNYAASLASNDWLLSIDCDEQLSPELRSSMLAWKQQAPINPDTTSLC